MVDLLQRQGQTESVLIDDKGIPIKIIDLAGFLDDIVAVYAEASNDYLLAWETLRKARSVGAAIE
jgi:hypothetical protein